MNTKKIVTSIIILFILVITGMYAITVISAEIPQTVLIGLIAVLITGFHFITIKWIIKEKQIDNNPNEKLPDELQEVYQKLALAKTDILNKEETLRKFSHIIEQSPTSIIITNLNGIIEYANPQACEVSGYGYEELVGKNTNILKSGDMPQEIYLELWKKISEGQIWRGEFCNKKKDGSKFWEYAHIAPVKNEYGRVTHFISIKEDITEKRKIEETHRMLSEALESINDVVTIFDLSGNIIYVNEAFTAYLGFDYDDIIGKNYKLLIPNDDVELMREKINLCINDGSWRGEIKTKANGGRIIDSEISLSTIVDDADKPTAIIAVTRDLTEEKSILEISRKAEMLTTVQELAGSVSHEFSQPLQALSNYIGLIKMGKLKKEYVEKSDLAVRRIASLVANLSEITSLKKQDYLNTKIINLKASARANDDDQEKRILVVDDEPQILETVTEMLRLSGYECDGAGDGLEALQKVSKNSYHLIISDINMPRMSGIRLYEKLKTIGYKEAFVFLTGYSLPSEMDNIIDEIDGLLNKPIEMKKLIKITKDIIGEAKIKS